MMIRFACPGCSVEFTVPVEQAGKTGRCPWCDSRFLIPEAPAAPTPAGDPNDPVEIHPCPKCSARLSVLAADLGGEIECPCCQSAFKALRADIPLPPPSKRVKVVDDEDDDRSSKRKSKRREDEDDDGPKKTRKLPRGLRDSRHRTYSPHDSILMLVLAVVGLLLNGVGIICLLGPFAGMVLGGFITFKSSLSIGEIKRGVMEPGGRVPLEVARGLAILIILLAIGVVTVTWMYNASHIGKGDGG
jgi:hypothetical protein